MQYLKDKNAFDTWKEHNQSTDVPIQPTEFPCYMYEITTSYGMEESSAFFLTKSDLLEMIDYMEKNR